MLILYILKENILNSPLGNVLWCLE